MKNVRQGDVDNARDRVRDPLPKHTTHTRHTTRTTRWHA
jgi:hypothetical protein